MPYHLHLPIKLLIFILVLLTACKSNTEIEPQENFKHEADTIYEVAENTALNNQLSNEQVSTPELTKLKELVQKLSQDYQEILTLEDMVVFMLLDEKEEYIKKYQEVLDKMDYVTADFKNELIQEIRNSNPQDDQLQLKHISDPLFRRNEAFEKIVFLGSDIEEDEAVIFVELAYPLIEVACCKTALSFRKIGHDWMLTGRSIDPDNHEFIFRNIDDYIGLYHHKNNPNNSYSIAKEGDIYVLKYCTPHCSLVGEIKGIEFKEGDEMLHLKNPTTKNAPNFRFNEKTLHVRKFDESTQQWEEEIYLFEEGEG